LRAAWNVSSLGWTWRIKCCRLTRSWSVSKR